MEFFHAKRKAMVSLTLAPPMEHVVGYLYTVCDQKSNSGLFFLRSDGDLNCLIHLPMNEWSRHFGPIGH